MQLWGYVESFHAALQRVYDDARTQANPGQAIEIKKLIKFTAYKDQYEAIKQRLNIKGEV